MRRRRRRLERIRSEQEEQEEASRHEPQKHSKLKCFYFSLLFSHIKHRNVSFPNFESLQTHLRLSRTDPAAPQRR